MARRRRDRGETSDDLLNELDNNTEPAPVPPMTASSIANQAYKSQVQDTFGAAARNKITARAIPLESIQPDPAQPRRALPSTVRHHWNQRADERSVALLFERWLAEINRVERAGRSPFQPLDYLSGSITDRAPATIDESENNSLPRIGADGVEMGPLEYGLLKIVDLAASIYRDGLTNPITVVTNGDGYRIETGERRWFAYHLLNHYGDALPQNQLNQDWGRIPARVVDSLDLWRQASENNAREDLNAVSKARQLALLLMDLQMRENDADFETFDAFEHEQDFYAQVADGSQWPVPTGRVEMLLNAMGLSHASQIRQYRAILRAPRELWQQADDRDMTEGEIRKRMQAERGGVTGVTPGGTKQSFIRWQERGLKSLRKDLRSMSRGQRQTILDELAAIVEEFS